MEKLIGMEVYHARLIIVNADIVLRDALAEPLHGERKDAGADE
jgi:hypothetical protein